MEHHPEEVSHAERSIHSRRAKAVRSCRIWSDQLSPLVSVTLGLVLTIAALFLVTGWDFQPIDLAVQFILLVGVGVGFWIARVPHE